ncbi:MAG TPA: hypothetical protein VGG33_13275, partial [Polyangia bacterium]
MSGEGGCTNCGKKSGCDHRKGAMFAAINEALERLYPSHRFEQRNEEADLFDSGVVSTAHLAERLSERLGTLVLEVPPSAEEYCRHLYVLCLGRRPSLIECLHGQVSAASCEPDGPDGMEELYLRVSVSDLAPFAAVQQVRLRAEVLNAVEGEGGASGASPPAGLQAAGLMIEETIRSGVFDPVLLPRYQRLVAVLVEEGLRNLDFGEIDEPPAGFDPGEHATVHGVAPVVANYLFYPQPCSSITTTVVPFSSPASEDD